MVINNYFISADVSTLEGNIASLATSMKTMCEAVDFMGASATPDKYDCCANEDTYNIFCTKRSFGLVEEGKAGECNPVTYCA